MDICVGTAYWGLRLKRWGNPVPALACVSGGSLLHDHQGALHVYYPLQITMKCSRGPLCTIKTLRTSSLSLEKKCFLRFSSAVQNPEADFCSCCWCSFFLSVQVSNNTNTVGTSWIAGDRNTLLGSWASGAISWVLRGLQLKPVWTWNPDRKVFVFS